MPTKTQNVVQGNRVTVFSVCVEFSFTWVEVEGRFSNLRYKYTLHIENSHKSNSAIKIPDNKSE